MYRVLNENGATMEEQSDIKYVKMQHNGMCRLCAKENADGIVAADGENFYALKGSIMETMGYEPVKVAEYVSDSVIIDQLNTNADSMAEMASDVAYLACMQELSDN
jgi:hypothetical protein